LFPLEAEGEIHFQSDGARLLDQRGSEEVFFTLAVSAEDLKCVEREETEGGWLNLELGIAFVDRNGRVLLRQGKHLEFACSERSAEDLFSRRLLYLQAALQPGTDEFEITLSDENAARTGLWARMRAEKKGGIARGGLTPPDVREGRGLSGAIFLWTRPDEVSLQGETGLFVARAGKARERLEPNPARCYGLANRRVRLYVEAYGLGGEEREATVRVLGRHAGTAILEERRLVVLPWPRTGIIAEVEISELAAGTYACELELVGTDETRETFRARGAFHVLWQRDSWSKTQAEILEEALVLLPDEILETFRTLPPGEREALLDSLWVGLGDRLPGTATGGREALFRERVAIADARYGRGEVRGAATDRGRVFIRYGEPDGIRKELNPQTEGQLDRFLRREIDEHEASEAGGMPVNRWLSDAAYRVWYYTNRGDSLVPEWDPPTRGRSLKFIFVDELGTGNYRLIYSNVFGGF
jgi:GWxTD domain-containing protein